MGLWGGFLGCSMTLVNVLWDFGVGSWIVEWLW